MRRLLLLVPLLLLAAHPTPTGQFTMSPGPYVAGQYVTFTYSDVHGVQHNDEFTLGVWCTRPDGTQIPWGNRANPYIYEFNHFGETNPDTLYLPETATCTARLIVADWFKGSVRQAWVLDEETFTVA